MKTLLRLFAAIFLFASCSKSGGDDPTPSQAATLVGKWNWVSDAYQFIPGGKDQSKASSSSKIYPAGGLPVVFGSDGVFRLTVAGMPEQTSRYTYSGTTVTFTSTKGVTSSATVSELTSARLVLVEKKVEMLSGNTDITTSTFTH